MAANTTPIFTLIGNKSRCKVSAANTARDGSGANGVLLLTADADGTRIDSIDWQHYNSSGTQVSIAAVGRIFLSDNATPGSGTISLVREIALTAVTPSNTAIGAVFTMTFAPALIIPSGTYLHAYMSVAQTTGGYDVVVNGGDF